MEHSNFKKNVRLYGAPLTAYRGIQYTLHREAKQICGKGYVLYGFVTQEKKYIHLHVVFHA